MLSYEIIIVLPFTVTNEKSQIGVIVLHEKRAQRNTNKKNSSALFPLAHESLHKLHDSVSHFFGCVKHFAALRLLDHRCQSCAL